MLSRMRNKRKKKIRQIISKKKKLIYLYRLQLRAEESRGFGYVALQGMDGLAEEACTYAFCPRETPTTDCLPVVVLPRGIP